MYEEFFPRRLAELRMAKNVSARDMSLSIGQSESYINTIENRKAFPSMQLFFYICEYLKVTPKEFFDDGTTDPTLLQSLLEDLDNLNKTQIKNTTEIIKKYEKLKIKP